MQPSGWIGTGGDTLRSVSVSGSGQLPHTEAWPAVHADPNMANRDSNQDIARPPHRPDGSTQHPNYFILINWLRNKTAPAIGFAYRVFMTS
jgi:hypothetical protein